LHYERTPVIELNRAVAVSFAIRQGEGLALLEDIERTGTLEHYAPFHLARADILYRLGRNDEALESQERALPFAPNDQVRRFIEQRVRHARRQQLLPKECSRAVRRSSSGLVSG